MSIGNISNRPASIQKDKINLLNFENMLKLPRGPTMENPGPIFPRAANTAVAVVSKSYPSIEISNIDAKAIAA